MDLSIRDELLRTAMAHGPALMRFLRGKLSDANDAEDLMQELYLSVLKAQQFQAIRHPKAYLFAVAANLAHQHRERRKPRPPHIMLTEVPAETLETAHAGLEVNAPECAVALAQRVSRLEQQLSGLSPKVRDTVLWHHRDGYTCDEIAEKLSVVPHRVKKFLVKGIAHCRVASFAADPTHIE